MLMDRIPRFDAHWSHFFAEFYWFVVLTSRLDTYISRYGDFCANNNDNNNNNDDDTTDYFTPCACAQGNNLNLSIQLCTTEQECIVVINTGVGIIILMHEKQGESYSWI